MESSESRPLRSRFPGTRLPFAALLTAASLAVLIAAGCGDSGNSSSGPAGDPAEILKATFSGDKTLEQGILDLNFEIKAEGGSNPGTFSATVNGPFDATGDGVPKFSIDIGFKGDTTEGDLNFTGAITSTGDGAFVNFEGADYEVPQELFDQFVTTYADAQAQSDQSGGANLLGSLDINPARWLTDLQLAGTEDVGGVLTDHVTGRADIPKLVQDLRKIGEQAGAATGQVDVGQLNQLDDSVRAAKIDIYSGVDDQQLRRLDATLQLDSPTTGNRAPDLLTIDFSISFSGIGEDQTINAPSETKPLAELLGRFGVNADQLGGALRGGVGSASPPAAGGDPSGPPAGGAEAYYKCLGQAGPAAEVQACAELLQ